MDRNEAVSSKATLCSLIPGKHEDQRIGSKRDPLMCQVDDLWILAGIVICIQTCEPGIYTNINVYRSWIEKPPISSTEHSATPWMDFLELFCYASASDFSGTLWLPWGQSENKIPPPQSKYLRWRITFISRVVHFIIYECIEYYTIPHKTWEMC